MPAVLHVLRGNVSPLASTTIERQAEAGDRVTIVLLEGAPAPRPVERVVIHRVPDDLSYSQLLDLVFEADQVIAW
jgi:hypothetical protein